MLIDSRDDGHLAVTPGVRKDDDLRTHIERLNDPTPPVVPGLLVNEDAHATDECDAEVICGALVHCAEHENCHEHCQHAPNERPAPKKRGRPKKNAEAD